MKTTTNAMRISKKRNAGFTLIEMVLVLAIIALLVGGSIQLLSGVGDEAKEIRVRGDFDTLATALQGYEMKARRFPTTQQGLKALVDKPSLAPVPSSWRQQMEKVPRDPWDEEYIFVQPGKMNKGKYDIISKGPDRAEGTEDDIGNWMHK